MLFLYCRGFLLCIEKLEIKKYSVMQKIKSPIYYIKELLTLALPITMGNFGFVFIGAGDVYVAAKYSTEVLAATSIANSVVSVIFIFGIGLLVSVSPILSNLRGSNKSAKKYFWPTIKFSMLSAFLTTLVIIGAAFLFEHIGIESNLVPLVRNYTLIISLSTFGGYLFAGLREFLQAFEIVVAPNLITIFSIFLNIVLNFIFAFGWGPIPSLGIVGLAIASVLTRCFMGIALLIYYAAKYVIRRYEDKCYYRNIIKVGLPISIAIIVEFFAFNFVTLIMATKSGVYAAVQNIVITLVNIAFMVPLSLSNAMAVKIGYANGRKNFGEMRKFSLWGAFLSVIFMAFCGLIFALFPEFLVGIFTKDMSVVAIAVPIFALLCVFEIFDGLQVALAGIFRGIKETDIPLIGNFIGYIIIGLSVGFFFAYRMKLDLYGFWIGLLVGSASLCAILTVIILIKFRRMRNTK
jgi:MATE family multidrug resistance protein